MKFDKLKDKRVFDIIYGDPQQEDCASLRVRLSTKVSLAKYPNAPSQVLEGGSAFDEPKIETGQRFLQAANLQRALQSARAGGFRMRWDASGILIPAKFVK